MTENHIRVTNALFNQRFLLGVYAPIILEFIVYAIYIAARGAEFNFAIILWALMLFAPALFIYMVSPMGIYYLARVGHYYRENLQKNIDRLFIFSDDEESLDDEQRKMIENAIEEQLIPELVKDVRGRYIDSYVSRSKHNQKDNLLSSFETLFLFSIVWSVLALADFIGVIILHYVPIRLDFIILDRIDNPINVIVFAVIFWLLTVVSGYLAYYSLGRLRKLIFETLPIVIYIDEEERINRNNYIRAVDRFPIENLVHDRTLRKYARRIDPIFRQEFQVPLAEAIRFYARNQVAKQQAWRIYKPILDKLKVSAKQTAVIKERFFASPFYEIARNVFSYDHEVISLKTDVEYVKNRLRFWEKISEEERATSLLFLFRSAEQLFKSILDRLGAAIEIYTNFNMILGFLFDNKIITKKEQQTMDEIRKKRNTMVHQSGKVIDIKKQEIIDFLEVLESVLLRVEKKFEKEKNSGAKKQR